MKSMFGSLLKTTIYKGEYEMKTIIIYRSKTGFTEKYAKWLAESLSCKAVSYDEKDHLDLAAYNTIIYGGSLHAGSIRGVKWFKREASKQTASNKIVLAVGAMPSKSPAVRDAIDQNFTAEEQKQIKVFYLQGGLNYEKLGFVDKQMMKMFAKMLAKKKDATEEEREAAKAVAGSYDAADRAFLKPVIEYIQQLRSLS